MHLCRAHALLFTQVARIHCAEGTAALLGDARGEVGPLALWLVLQLPSVHLCAVCSLCREHAADQFT